MKCTQRTVSSVIKKQMWDVPLSILIGSSAAELIRLLFRGRQPARQEGDALSFLMELQTAKFLRVYDSGDPDSFSVRKQSLKEGAVMTAAYPWAESCFY